MVEVFSLQVVASDPNIPPDCLSLPYWRSGLKYWMVSDGNGSFVTRFSQVDAAITQLENAKNADGSMNVAYQRQGVLAREQFEYANSVTRAQLQQYAAVFGFTAAEADESLWRAERVRLGDLNGTWPLPTSS